MKFRSVVLGVFLLTSSAFCEDGVFLTLTRSAASPRTTPTQTSTISREDIERSGAETLDEALTKLTSAQIQPTGLLGSFSTLRMRGAPSSAQVQVLVDGVPLGGISTQYVDLSQIPLHDVERIEVVRGGSSVLYGANTLGGVVNIITQRSTESGARTVLEQETRSFFTQIYRGSFETAQGPWNGRVTAGRSLTDGFQDNSDGDQISASANLGRSWENAARVDVDLSRVSSEVGANAGTTVPLGEWNGKKEKAVVDAQGRVKNASTRGRVNTTIPFGQKGTWGVLVYGFDQDYDYSSLSFGDTERKNIVWGADSHVGWGGTTLGVAWERDNRATRSAETGPFQRDHIVNTALYLQEVVSLGDWSFLPALRRDEHSRFGNTLNPRLAVVYAPSDRTKWSWSAARSFRAPDMASLFDFYPGFLPFFGATLPNPDLKPETAWGYDMGLEKNTAAGVWRVSGFYTLLKDRIYYTQRAAPLDNTVLNGPQAELSGVEFSHQKTGPHFSLESSYTYLRALGNHDGQSHIESVRLSPRHTAWAQLGWTPGRGWALINEGRYVHRQFTDDGDRGTKLPSYTLWNASLRKNILAAEFVLGVDNVTDKHYAATGTNYSLNPQPGRTYRFSTSIRFQN